MKFPAATRARILLDPVTLDFDPAGATIEYQVDETWYACSWLSDGIQAGDVWKRQARTDAYFSGTAQASTVALAAGRHRTRTRVTLAGEQIVWDSSPIDIT